MPDKNIGTTLDGRYQIQEIIGEGGMANVYKGFDLANNRVVAVKILKQEFNDNAELIRRFKNESRAISVLNHPNIVKVYDISVSEDMQYIVMEYIDGITLKAYIEQRGEPLTYKETVHFVSQILKALQHAHDKGIVHRDIKPQNIMLLADGSVKVMDFGIARLSRSESHTVTDQALGSVHYISPEQAKGDATDPRADIYSLGITMYEMLTGKLPFESDNAVSIAIKQISDQAVPVRKLNSSVPPGLESITMKAMAKDPRRRYQGALEMLRDLEEFKRNPNIRFDYDDVNNNEYARNGNTVAKSTRNGAPGKAAAGKKRKKRPKLLVPIMAGITFVVVVICAIISISIFQNSGTPLFGKVKEIELPSFVGMQLADVQALLQQDQYKNLRLQDPTYEYRDGVAANEVLSQNPTAPKTVKENQKIYLVVSRGVQQVEVPDLSGMDRAEATQAILALGMRPYVKSQVDSSIAVGRVISTFPTAGSTVENTPETVIEIYVSSRPKDIDRQVPDLTILSSLADAKKLLEENDLQIGTTKEEYSDTVPAGGIISQHPEQGTTVDVFTSVHVVVSIGPAPPPEPVKVAVPGIVGSSYSDAAAALSAVGLNISNGGSVADSSPAGTVVQQSIAGGTEVEEGTTVVVIVSAGPASSSSTPTPPASSSSVTPPTSSSAVFTLPKQILFWVYRLIGRPL
ncbi:MAG: Stk1 family PASTA domain-containing Ser/Thr kinase [Oscillospiraceae bacterium]